MKKRTRRGNGSGSVYFERGKWRGKYSIRGQKKRPTVTFDSAKVTKRTEADAALRAILVDIERGVHIEPSQILFRDFAPEWLEEHIVREGLKRTTASSYRTILRRHLLPRQGRIKVAEITTGKVKAFTSKQIERGLSARSVNSHVQVLGLILGGAVDAGIIDRNPVTKSCRVKQRNHVDLEIMLPEQAQAVEKAYAALILEATGDRLDDLETSKLHFEISYGLGLRRGEILGLRWRHVNLEADPPVLEVAETYTAYRQDTPKSEASRRKLRIPGKLVAGLERHLRRSHYGGADDLVVPNPRSGRPLDVHRHAELLGEACAKAEVPVPARPYHDLRHAFCTLAALTATNPYSVQRRAGHSSMETTKRYLHLAGQLFEDDAAALEEKLYGEAAASN
jgi:integrase